MASPHARQKKLEKKRLRREEKRRARRSAGPVLPAFIPAEKMSDCLNQLIEPLLDLVEPEDCTLATFQKTLMLGALAWNLSVIHGGADLDEALDRITQDAADEVDPADFRSALSLLVSYKRAFFPSDDRIVIEAHIDEGEDGFRIHAASTLVRQR